MARAGCLLAELWGGLSRRHPVLAFTGVRGYRVSQPAEQIPVLLTQLTTDVTSEGSIQETTCRLDEEPFQAESASVLWDLNPRLQVVYLQVKPPSA